MEFPSCVSVALAEFDIDKGGVIRDQYPVPMNIEPGILADLMIPEGAHHREEDVTIFFVPSVAPDGMDQSSPTANSAATSTKQGPVRVPTSSTLPGNRSLTAAAPAVVRAFRFSDDCLDWVPWASSSSDTSSGPGDAGDFELVDAEDSATAILTFDEGLVHSQFSDNLTARISVCTSDKVDSSQQFMDLTPDSEVTLCETTPLFVSCVSHSHAAVPGRLLRLGLEFADESSKATFLHHFGDVIHHLKDDADIYGSKVSTSSVRVGNVATNKATVMRIAGDYVVCPADTFQRSRPVYKYSGAGAGGGDQSDLFLWFDDHDHDWRISDLEELKHSRSNNLLAYVPCDAQDGLSLVAESSDKAKAKAWSVLHDVPGDPYVTLTLGDQTLRTATKHSTATPSWQELVTFVVDVAEVKDLTLTLAVMDEDVGSTKPGMRKPAKQDDTLGLTLPVRLADLASLDTARLGTFPTAAEKLNLQLEDSAGSLSFEITFQLTSEEEGDLGSDPVTKVQVNVFVRDATGLRASDEQLSSENGVGLGLSLVWHPRIHMRGLQRNTAQQRLAGAFQLDRNHLHNSRCFYRAFSEDFVLFWDGSSVIAAGAGGDAGHSVGRWVFARNSNKDRAAPLDIKSSSEMAYIVSNAMTPGLVKGVWHFCDLLNEAEPAPLMKLEAADVPHAEQKPGALSHQRSWAELKGISKIVEEPEEEDFVAHDGDLQLQMHKVDEAGLFCLNIVKTVRDSSVKRGARCKALAICTPLRFYALFRPLLSLALSKSFDSDVSPRKVLSTVYRAINELDLITAQLKVPSSIQSQIWRAGVAPSHLAVLPRLQSEVMRGNDKHFCNGYTATLEWQNVSIDLAIPVTLTDDMVSDVSLVTLVQTFGTSTMTIMNSILAGRRTLFLGYNHPAESVCRHVLSAVLLVCPPLRGVLKRVVPYATLSNLSFVDKAGYIAGVTNPMFEAHEQWWDTLCLLDTGRVVESASVQAENREEEARGLFAASEMSEGGAAVSRISSREAVDSAFIEGVMDGILCGSSEMWVRARFSDYLRSIVEKGVGTVGMMTPEQMQQYMSANGARIEQWKRTDTHPRFLADHLSSNRKPKIANLGHEVTSLQMLTLSTEDLVRTYEYLIDNVTDESDLLELLALLPESRGGVYPIAVGLMHPATSIRLAAATMLIRLDSVQMTFSLAKLNPFFKQALDRVSAAGGLL